MTSVEDYRRVAPPGVVDIILKLSERVRGRRLLHLSAGASAAAPPRSSTPWSR